jgi:hypothetical protein
VEKRKTRKVQARVVLARLAPFRNRRNPETQVKHSGKKYLLSHAMSQDSTSTTD